MKRYVFLLVLAVAIAGCTVPGQQQDDGPKVIGVQGPKCTVGGQPCSSVSMTKYDDPVRVTLEFTNNGDEPVTVFLDPSGPELNFGRSILTSKCNDEIAEISEYEVRLESNRGTTRMVNPSEIGAESPDEEVEVDEDTRMTITWLFEVPDDLSVSRLGYTCPLSFDLSFEQELEASRQIQLKAGREVRDVDRLDSTRTSKFPVKLVIDAPRSVVADEGRTLIAEGFLRNVGPGEITGVNKLEPASGSWVERNAESCQPDDIRMYQSGERAGESYRKTCTIPLSSLGTSSDIRWLEYSASYRYDMPPSPSTINLKIEPVEGAQ